MDDITYMNNRHLIKSFTANSVFNSKEINFVFDDVENHLNFTNCKDLNSSGIARFTPSPVAITAIRLSTARIKNYYSNIKINVEENFEKDKIIIIPTGVTHSPPDWTGYGDLQKRYDDKMRKTQSILYYVNEERLLKLKNKTAFLLIDQTHEGYHVDWLFDWFHDMCKHYNVSPNQIIYTTGDLDSSFKYENWCQEQNYNGEKLNIVPHAHFEQVINTTMVNNVKIKNSNPLPRHLGHLTYKKQNIDSVKVYSCLQKRTRGHRMWLFSELFQNDLLDDGLLSMNSFEHRHSYYEGKTIPVEIYNEFIKLLPIYPEERPTVNDQHAFESASGSTFITDLNTDTALNSFVTVVSEAQFAENNCFLSEKTFKPIANCHPFIIYGNKGSLKHLHNLGYKTFSNWWREDYDDYDTWNRLAVIIDILKQLQEKSKQELIDMYKDMRSVIEHNYNIFNKNSKLIDPVTIRISELTNA